MLAADTAAAKDLLTPSPLLARGLANGVLQQVNTRRGTALNFLRWWVQDTEIAELLWQVRYVAVNTVQREELDLSTRTPISETVVAVPSTDKLNEFAAL